MGLKIILENPNRFLFWDGPNAGTPMWLELSRQWRQIN